MQVGIFTVTDLVSKVGFGLYFLFNYGMPHSPDFTSTIREARDSFRIRMDYNFRVIRTYDKNHFAVKIARDRAWTAPIAVAGTRGRLQGGQIAAEHRTSTHTLFAFPPPPAIL